jgi:hypothetical protein
MSATDHTANTVMTTAGPDPAVMEAVERGNAVVFLDVVLGEPPQEASLGRIKLELFAKDVRALFRVLYVLYSIN